MLRVQWLTFRRRAGSAPTLNFFWNFFSTFISMVLVLFNCNCVPKSFFSGQGPALEGSWGRSLLRADRGETALAPAYILILTLRTRLLLKWAKALLAPVTVMTSARCTFQGVLAGSFGVLSCVPSGLHFGVWGETLSLSLGAGVHRSLSI